METPFSGTAVLLLIAGVLWLVYLVPIWLRRSEYLATERNATRLGQTLRVLAHTAEATEELTAELSARDVVRQQRQAEAQLRAVSFTPAQLQARRRRVLRSTTTLFTAIGLVGFVSSISFQAAMWVTAALAAKTLLGFAMLSILARSRRKAVAGKITVESPRATSTSQPRASGASRIPPALPEPLSKRQAVVTQAPPLPNREELLRRARQAAAEARPEQAAAERELLAPVSQFDQMGRVDQGGSPSQIDLDEVLRRRRAV